MADPMESIRGYLFAARMAAMDSATSKAEWLYLIRRGQAIQVSGLVWTCLCAMVQLAIVGGHGAKLKEAALDLYQEQALAGDQEACELLWNYALMAGDEELKSHFWDKMPFVSVSEGGGGVVYRAKAFPGIDHLANA